MRNYKALIKSGTTAQIEKLKANEHKKGFDNIPLHYAVERLKDEMRELEIEFTGSVSLDYDDIRSEAADVANFAHMIIHRCDQLR